MDIAKKLKEARELARKTQTQVSKETGINNKTLSGYERGVSEPDLQTLSLLADYYKVSLDYLLCRELSHENKTQQQEEYIESLKLDTAEDAIKFILQQPSIMEFGGYNLNEMSEEEILDLANDLLFAMRLSLEKNKKK